MKGCDRGVEMYEWSGDVPKQAALLAVAYFIGGLHIRRNGLMITLPSAGILPRRLSRPAMER